MDIYKHIGIGWEFPPRFDKNGVKLVDGGTEIKQSLEILLTTTPGERIFRPDYGCNIRRWIFSKMSLSEETLLKDTIKNAIMKGEPRITLTQILIEIKDQYEGILMIELNYIINSTNTTDNMVFPFFFAENNL